MFHEPSLPASTWPMMKGVPLGSRVADRVTSISGSGRAEEVGLGDVGDVDGARRQAAVGRRIELAGEDDRVVGDVGRVVDGQPEPPSSTTKTWIG